MLPVGAVNWDSPVKNAIAAGTEVSFLNADSAPHTVTEGTDGQAADSPIIDEELGQGAATSFTFDEPGTFKYICTFHPFMNAPVEVVE